VNDEGLLGLDMEWNIEEWVMSSEMVARKHGLVIVMVVFYDYFSVRCLLVSIYLTLYCVNMPLPILLPRMRSSVTDSYTHILIYYLSI